MTNFTTKLMVAAATFVAAAGAASAQTLKAEIPFTFRANGVVMEAGTYRVRIDRYSAGTPMVTIQTQDGHRTALAVAFGAYDVPKAWVTEGNPKLSFECGVSRCSLTGFWTGDKAVAYKVPAPKLGKDEPVRVAVVGLRPDRVR